MGLEEMILRYHRNIFFLLFSGFLIVQFKSPACASSDVYPFDARVEHRLPNDNYIALDCLTEGCFIEGVLAGKTFKFLDEEFSMGREPESWGFTIYLPPNPEDWTDVSFSAEVSIPCESYVVGISCFSNFTVFKGKIIDASVERKEIKSLGSERRQ